MLFLFPFQAMAEKQLLHNQSTRCGECGKAFSSSSNRDRHVQQSHPGLRPFRCGEEDCQKTFARTEGLTLHRRSAHRRSGSSQESDSDSDTGNFKRSSRIVNGRIIIRKQRPEVREAGLQAQRTLPWNAMYIKQSASDPRPPMGDPVIDLTKETPSAKPDSGVDWKEDPYRRRELKRRAARECRHREREERERREKMARKEDIPAPTKATSPRSAPDVSTPDVAAASRLQRRPPLRCQTPLRCLSLLRTFPRLPRPQQSSPQRRPRQPQLRSTGRPRFSGMHLRPWLSRLQPPEMLLTPWLLRPRSPGMVLCRWTLTPQPRPPPKWDTQIGRRLGLPRTSLSPLLTPDPASPLFTCRSPWSARRQLNGFKEESIVREFQPLSG